MNRIPVDSHDLIINREKGHLRKLEEFLKNVFLNRKISRSDFNRILLCISEGVSNAIVHGNKNNLGKRVYLTIEMCKSEVVVTIRDEGGGFDVSRIPDPTTEVNRRKEKGRGLYIIRTYAKGLEFLNQGNTLKMKFDICGDNIS